MAVADQPVLTSDGRPVQRRPLLPATFRGVAAVWLWRRIEAEAAGAPAALARVAGPEAGRDLALALSELREAVRQWTEHVAKPAGSDVVTAEPVILRSGAASVVEEITTCEAAEMLGVSDGMVRRWCRTELLVARQAHQRLWLVERSSALDLLEARRSA